MRHVTRHITHAGYSIPAAAKALQVPEGTVRRAVKNGEIRTVPFGGLDRITPSEIERIRALLELGKDGPAPPYVARAVEKAEVIAMWRGDWLGGSNDPATEIGPQTSEPRLGIWEDW